MATKKPPSTKSRSRAKKVSVRDLVPKKKKGAVKGGGTVYVSKYEMFKAF